MKASLVTILATVGLATASPHELQARGSTAPYGIKKGLAYNNGAITSALSAPGSATWSYNWGAALNAPLFQQIPMMWGPGSRGDSAGVLRAVKGGSPWVLGYNEPDQTLANGGCAQTPRQAYDAWGNDMFKFSDAGARLVCPGISSWDTNNGATGGPSGLTWLRQFASIGNNPSQFRCSAQALHWYGENGKSAAQQAELFKNYIQSASRTVNDIFKTNMLIWVTEFSPLPVNNAQLMADFLAIVIPWLNAQDYVDRYSPFMADYFVTNGAPNAAGRALINSK